MSNDILHILQTEAIDLLKQLVAIPSFSREEEGTADRIAAYLRSKNIPAERLQNKGKLFGLGSNDAGGALVSLIATFIYYYTQKNLTHNLLLAATAEEEI